MLVPWTATGRSVPAPGSPQASLTFMAPMLGSIELRIAFSRDLRFGHLFIRVHPSDLHQDRLIADSAITTLIWLVLVPPESALRFRRGLVARESPFAGTLLLALRDAPPGLSVRSCRMPCQPFDAREDLTKEGSGQVGFCELQREVPGMPDQPPAGLEKSL